MKTSKPSKPSNSASVIALMAGSSAIALASLACGASGSGSGELVTPATTTAAAGTETGTEQGKVDFYWKSEGSAWTRGTISATLPNGRTFQGNYIEPSTVSNVAVNNWMGWGCGWDTCFGGPAETTVTNYSGQIVARLDDGQTRMTCKFNLADPPAGPAHGGTGDCTLSNGDKVTGAQLHEKK